MMGKYKRHQHILLTILEVDGDAVTFNTGGATGIASKTELRNRFGLKALEKIDEWISKDARGDKIPGTEHIDEAMEPTLEAKIKEALGRD